MEPANSRSPENRASSSSSPSPSTLRKVTEGSVTFRSVDGDGDDELDALFSGDLLFAGSIGRTDLPGGDDRKMMSSLAKTLTLPDQTVVLPGHGPHTTIGAERAANPFLTGLPAPGESRPAR